MDERVKPKVRILPEGHRIITGDCLDVLKQYADDSVDLVITSPPYLDVRSYSSLGFDLNIDEWVPWAKERFIECCRVSRGAVAWVVEGKTKNYTYQPSPFLLMTELHRAGIKLRKPLAFHRVGIPGSGGPDWFRNDWEPIICATKGKLPWSDNTACGHPPKWAPGGNPSNRTKDGTRANSKMSLQEKLDLGEKVHTKSDAGGKRKQAYLPPERANPGNVIHAVVGGGLLGSDLAHENEAPFPESLPEFFIKSCCPPGGTVLDPFCGSGTTLAAAVLNGRIAHCIDIRESQADLMHRRYLEAKDRLSRSGVGHS